jgi:hypothetical protein
MKVVTKFFLFALVLLSAGVSAMASDQATIEAAKKEGSLMIYNSMTPADTAVSMPLDKYPSAEVKDTVVKRLLTKIFTGAGGRLRRLLSVTLRLTFSKRKISWPNMCPEVKYLPRFSIRKVTGRPLRGRKLATTHG